MFVLRVVLIPLLILVLLIEVILAQPAKPTIYCPTPPLENTTPYVDPLVEQLTEIILQYHQTINKEGTKLSYTEAREAANEIVYLVDVMDMNREEDIPHILSLFYQESKFDPLAENSYSSAKGFGQILMSIHGHKFAECGNWMDPGCNIYIAFKIFSYDRSIQDPRTRWIRALTGYSGSRSAATASLRFTSMFDEELDSPILAIDG